MGLLHKIHVIVIKTEFLKKAYYQDNGAEIKLMKTASTQLVYSFNTKTSALQSHRIKGNYIIKEYNLNIEVTIIKTTTCQMKKNLFCILTS